MASDITIYWAGAPDADNQSTYKIRRSFDLNNWTTLAAGQAATAPYAAVRTTLAAQAQYGDTTLTLTSAGSVSASGGGYLNKAFVRWTGKNGNQLTGVTWESGGGTYVVGAAFAQAHESYADIGVDGFNLTVFYEITHQRSNLTSEPCYLVQYMPPKPASPDHCVLIVVVGTDVGQLARRSGVTVTCALADDTAFDPFGAQADANRVAAENSKTTGVDGATAFQLWRSSALAAATGGSVPLYTVTLGANETGSEQSYTLTSVPDGRKWMLLDKAV